MFGHSDNQDPLNDDGTPSAAPSVVSQSNMILQDTPHNDLPPTAYIPPGSQTPAAPDPPSAPPPPPPSLTNTPTLPVPGSTPPPPPVTEPIKPSSPINGLPDVKLDNAYISTTPPPPSAKKVASTPDVKLTTASLFSPASDKDLLEMKQQALNNLAPLVDKLDQTPEEKFRTTMMMIQASDNHELLKEAYEIANQIKDDKARAQALLDVVNEINYFTQQAQGSSEPADKPLF